jgi:hypothetical protein
MSEETRIQLRGFCIYCGKVHATSNERMVNHGYTVDWGSFNGACYGTGKVHYGHETAPQEIAEYIQLQEQKKISIPAEIARLKLSVQGNEEALASGTVANATERDELRRKIKSGKKTLFYLAFMLDEGIDLDIYQMNKAIENWKLTPLVEVDVMVEEADARKAREVAAAEKKGAKLAANEVKAKAQADREAKALANAKAKHDALTANNHYRLFYCGELVEEWEQTADDEDSIIRMFAAKVKAHWESLGKDEEWRWVMNRYFYDVRNKPKGGGKSLLSFYLWSAKVYFDVDWKPILAK